MTQENEYTPGPWHFEFVDESGKEQTYRIYADCEPLDGVGALEDETNNLIMADTRYYPYVPHANDARLMASAPELLEALEACLAGGNFKHQSIAENARNVIKKARGEQC